MKLYAIKISERAKSTFVLSKKDYCVSQCTPKEYKSEGKQLTGDYLKAAIKLKKEIGLCELQLQNIAENFLRVSK